MFLRLAGERGVLEIDTPVLPHWGHELRLSIGGQQRDEKLDATPTYVFQWRAIAAAIRTAVPILTPAASGLPTLRLMDAIYRAAGLRPRGT
ncbi:MAG: gfo/Idh/MocA family oxidoreductase, partial [Gammaproteobacteria bacterium]